MVVVSSGDLVVCSSTILYSAVGPAGADIAGVTQANNRLIETARELIFMASLRRPSTATSD
jgi:hypothetical protein